jgi:hypothetical protein
MGIPKTLRFGIPTNNHVRFENGGHRQFNLMFVSTLQVSMGPHFGSTVGSAVVAVDTVRADGPTHPQAG